MRYFTDEHEWIEVDGDVATVGITHHAQDALGDVVFVEMPDAGLAVAAMHHEGRRSGGVDDIAARFLQKFKFLLVGDLDFLELVGRAALDLEGRLHALAFFEMDARSSAISPPLRVMPPTEIVSIVFVAPGL